MTSLGSLAVVLEEHEAYNAHDLDRYMEGFAPDALILDGDGRTMSDGAEAIRTDIGRVFERMPDVHADVPTSFEAGEWVAMHDIVPNWLMPDGSHGEMQWVALYHVVDDKIVSLQLFPGSRPA